MTATVSRTPSWSARSMSTTTAPSTSWTAS
ncbi:hypothetical protein RB2654_15210 [Rhodobacterales bacterium HTCC2654]|uniref:Uncharacterized protein n=1 Tax=Maritimibacter alkaliphilus HTCC2654 TaxID=314271 RepID=A3VH91_9RHOB|nr:hypothetical protein RB2654_15210 [Rhodobacterales bacterium HTCC2654] [Maritimibacter alkaliphilus HTCC2654]